MIRRVMSKSLVALLAAIVFPLQIQAQSIEEEYIDVDVDLLLDDILLEIEAPEGYEYADTIIYRQNILMDTTLVNKDVFYDLPSIFNGYDAAVNVSQSPLIEDSMRSFVKDNRKRAINGYRVRIFFDNKQNARYEAEKVLREFRSIYHNVTAYMVYANPYFKVAVGDCRTRSEAMALLTMIKKDFPSAFVVKESIFYPPIDKENAFVADTVTILRPLPQPEEYLEIQ